jgi:hypothetical protein
MSFDINFEPPDCELEFDDESSRSTVEAILRLEEFKRLEKSNIFILFDFLLPYWTDRYNARIYPTDYPSFNHFFNEYASPDLKYNMQSRNFDFIIHIQRKNKNEDYKILKAIDLAHEFQHIVQYRNNFETFCMNDVLYQASNVLKFPLKEPNPLEKEAMRISKKISYRSFGKDEVDSFVRSMLNNPEAIKDFWEVFSWININTANNPKDEIKKIWIQYEPEIVKKIGEIDRKSNISKEEEKMRERYHFYLKKKK